MGTDYSNMQLVARSKIGKYSFLIYYKGGREYCLLVKQNSEMRPLLKWVCGHSPNKASLISDVTGFICLACPGSRSGKVRATVGDELRYTCYAYPVGSKIAVANSQTTVRELQKLVPTDMREQVEALVAHLCSRSPVTVSAVNYDDESAPCYTLTWDDGFSEQFDFDFVDVLFKTVRLARVPKRENAKVTKEKLPAIEPPSRRRGRPKAKGGRA